MRMEDQPVSGLFLMVNISKMKTIPDRVIPMVRMTNPARKCSRLKGSVV